MADKGAENFVPVEKIDISQVVLIQSVFRGALVRKWMQELRHSYETVLKEIERTAAGGVDWQLDCVCRPKITKGRPSKSDNITKSSSRQATDKSRKMSNNSALHTVPETKHAQVSTSFINYETDIHERKEPSFHSIEIQTSFIDANYKNKELVVQNDENADSEGTDNDLENGKILEDLDTSWKDRVEPFLQNDFKVNSKESSPREKHSDTELHLALDSARESVSSVKTIESVEESLHSERSGELTVNRRTKSRKNIYNEKDKLFTGKKEEQSEKAVNMHREIFHDTSVSNDKLETKSVKSDRSGNSYKSGGKHELESVKSLVPESGEYEIESVNSNRSLRSGRSDRSGRRSDSSDRESRRESHRRTDNRSYRHEEPISGRSNKSQRSYHDEGEKISERSRRSSNRNRSSSRERHNSDRSHRSNSEQYYKQSESEHGPSRRSSRGDIEMCDEIDKGQRSHRSERSESVRSRSSISEKGQGQLSDRSQKCESQRSSRSEKGQCQLSDRSQKSGSQRSSRSEKGQNQLSDRSQKSQRSDLETARQKKEILIEDNMSPRYSARSPTEMRDKTKTRGQLDSKLVEPDNRQSINSTTLTNVTSVWDSVNSVRESHEPVVISPLPQDPVKLQEIRKNVSMELLWIQQAIDSRKNYLKLKGTL